MRVVGRLVLVSAGVGLVLAAQVARAQAGCTFTDDSGKTVFWPNCEPPTDPKAAAGQPGSQPGNQPGTTAPANGGAPAQVPAAGSSPVQSFPFPGERTAAPNAANPNAAAGQQGAAGGSTNQPGGNKFPFPGEGSGGQGAAPQGANGNGPLKDAGSSGDSSSSSSSSSGGPDEGDRDPSAGPLGDDADTDPAAKAAEARRAERLKKEHSVTVHQTSDQREAEDLRVASFYQDDGNFRGAYERATDAVSLAADDAEAHLALAEAARRLGKLDEAAVHYKKCLTLDPVPRVKKAAEKALKSMTAGGM
jgi:hypothetical protein